MNAPDRHNLFAYGAWTDASHRNDAQNHDLAVIDLKTTGRFTPTDRVCEIGMVRVRNSVIIDTFSTLVNPGSSVGPQYVHHIPNRVVQDAPSFEDIAGELVDRIRGAVVVAHDAPFEEAFLTAEFTHAGVALPAVPALCTHALAATLFENRPGFALNALCVKLGARQVSPHTALGDARTTADVALRLFSHAATLGLQPGVPIAPPELPHVPVSARPHPRPLDQLDYIGR